MTKGKGVVLCCVDVSSEAAREVGGHVFCKVPGGTCRPDLNYVSSNPPSLPRRPHPHWCHGKEGFSVMLLNNELNENIQRKFQQLLYDG